jgi:hypothetical protein
MRTNERLPFGLSNTKSFDLSSKIAFIRENHLIAASLETSPDYIKHPPPFWGKERIMRGRIFCEQNFHLIICVLPWKITLSDR